MKQTCRGCAWAVLLMAVSVGMAGEWPQFRGPSGQGIADGSRPPAEWNQEQNVAWRSGVPGEGWSSPVVADGRVYLTTATELSGTPLRSLRLICWDVDSGSLLWNREVFRQNPAKRARIHRKNSHASPTPVVRGDKIYVHFGHQGTACLDRNGELVWENRSLEYEPVHGAGGSPVIVDDRLVFTCDGAEEPFVVALSTETGKVIWRTPRSVDARQSFSFCTPQVIEVNGQTQIISPGSDMVAAYDPEDGREIWRVTYDGYSVVARPVYANGLIFMSTAFNRPEVLAIRPTGRGDLTDSHVAWRLVRGAPKIPSMLAVGDELFMISDSGIMTCVDSTTGEIHWQERLSGSFSASPLYAAGRIYLQNEEGTGYVVDAGTNFQQQAVNDLDERTLASYAVDGNAFLIRSDRALYRIESASSR